MRSAAAAAIVLCCGMTLAFASAHAQSGGAKRFDDPAPYCAAVGTIDRPDARYTGPAMPDWVAEALKRASGAAPGAPLEIFKRGIWRCAAGTVLACTYGANIPCDGKADTRTTPGPGAREYCRDNPGAEIVPAYATGHSTIYAWHCVGNRPAVGRQVLERRRRGLSLGLLVSRSTSGVSRCGGGCCGGGLRGCDISAMIEL